MTRCLTLRWVGGDGTKACPILRPDDGADPTLRAERWAAVEAELAPLASQSGGAIDGTPVTDCTIEGNEANADGSGVRINGIGNVLTNVVVFGNDAGNYGGGVLLSTGAATTLTDSTIEGNASTNPGGGLFAYAGGLITLNGTTTVLGNSASSGAGAYLWTTAR